MKLDPNRMEVVDDAVAAALKKMDPSRRLEMVFQAEEFARTLMEAGIRSRHPGWNDLEVRQEAARLWRHGPA